MIVIFFFAFSVLAPMPLAAADNLYHQAQNNVQRQAQMTDDDSRFQNQFRSFKEFWKNDWQQTKNDFISIKLKLYKLRKDLFNRNRSSWAKTLDKLKGNLLTKASDTIDEIGPRNFHRMVFEVSGQKLLQLNADIDSPVSDQVLAAKMMKEISTTFDAVASDLSKAGPEELDQVLEQTEAIVDRLKKGDSQEDISIALQNEVNMAEHGNGHSQGKTKRFFKAAYRVFMALFMTASVGAISLVSLGFLSAAVAGGSILFAALGTAATIACIIGVVKYMKEGIAAIKGKPSLTYSLSTKGIGTGKLLVPMNFEFNVPMNFQFNMKGAY